MSREPWRRSFADDDPERVVSIVGEVMMNQSIERGSWMVVIAMVAAGCAPAASGRADGGSDACATDGADGAACGAPVITPPPPTNGDCATYCRRASVLACTSTLAEARCTEACEQARAVVAGTGACATAFEAVIRCRAQSALSCDPESGSVVAPACAALEQQAENCGG